MPAFIRTSVDCTNPLVDLGVAPPTKVEGNQSTKFGVVGNLASLLFTLLLPDNVTTRKRPQT